MHALPHKCRMESGAPAKVRRGALIGTGASWSGGLPPRVERLLPERKIIAPSDTSLAPDFAICAAGSPFATPLAILNSLTSTYMPSLLASCPTEFGALQLSVMLLIFTLLLFHGLNWATATVVVAPAAMPRAT